jgi:hypothetical protein
MSFWLAARLRIKSLGRKHDRVDCFGLRRPARSHDVPVGDSIDTGAELSRFLTTWKRLYPIPMAACEVGDRQWVNSPSHRQVENLAILHRGR